MSTPTDEREGVSVDIEGSNGCSHWTCEGCACKCHQPIDVEGLRRYVRLFEIENDGIAP
jgi:hypothetical protein